MNLRKHYIARERRDRILRQQQLRGLGYVREYLWEHKWPANLQAPVCLNSTVVEHDYESYTRRYRVKVPVTIAKGPYEQLSNYLHLYVADTYRCHCQYDCCGHMIPMTAKIVARKSRVIIVEQTYYRNC